MFVIGASVSVYQAFQSARQGNWGFSDHGIAKSGLDIGMSAVGLAGPLGATASFLYFTGDMIGWDRIWNTAQKTAPAQCNPFIMMPSQILR